MEALVAADVPQVGQVVSPTPGRHRVAGAERVYSGDAGGIASHRSSPVDAGWA